MGGSVLRAISFTDLKSVGIELDVEEGEEFIRILGATKDGKPLDLNKGLKNILYQLGVIYDGNSTVEPKSTHRRINGKVTENYRITGKERTDRKWLTSGYASEEAKMASSRMKDMVAHTQRLSRGGD